MSPATARSATPPSPPAQDGERRVPGWAPVAVAAAAIWLGWQALLVPISQRAPPEAAIRLNPGSHTVLRRAAEAELTAGRVENAQDLARRALVLNPFDVRSLRMVGLAADKEGRTNEADQILTLAGNWSLRDDPTHRWLIVQRLRQGNYVSAFAHADTLARRERSQDRVFHLFTAAAQQDPRAVPVLVRLLENQPPWEGAYFDSLYQSPEGVQLAAGLTLLLEERGTPLNDDELRRLYFWLLRNASPQALSDLRVRLDRPKAEPGVIVNGDFENEDAQQPFQWVISQLPGLVVDIAEPPRGATGSAMRVSYDSLSDETLVEQFIALPPGPATMTGRVLDETPDAARSLTWRLACIGGGGIRSPESVRFETPDSTGWRRFTLRFDVPSQGCAGQMLRLGALPSSERISVTTWYDHLAFGGHNATVEGQNP